MSGVAGAIIGGAVLGAGASIYASSQSAGAIKDASSAATGAELQMYNQSRQDLAPYREAGYGALDQINQLYGIAPQSRVSSTSPITVAQRNQGGYNFSGGQIDPVTGMVTVTDSDPAAYNEALTNYLRTGEWTLNPRQTRYVSDVKNQIDSLRAHGWNWDAENNRGALPETATQAPGGRDLSAFYTSPQYEFVRSEGLRGQENSAAARGGAFSGNAIRGSEMFASNLASGEFDSYVDRLFSIAGLGSNATNTGVAAGQNTSNSLANIYTNAGMARGSAYAGGAAGVNSAIQGGLQNWAFYNYMNPGGGGGSGGGGAIPPNLFR